MAQVNLGTAEGRIVVDGSGAKGGFAVATSAAEAFFNVIADRVNELEQVGDRLTKIGAVAAGGFGLAINAAAGFEQRLSAIEAVSGATEAQMDAISKKALQLGADTKFSAGEAAQAMEELVKAGVSVDDVLNGAADATVALAAAGEIDLPRAAEIASNAMNVFNLSAAEMPKVADLIAGAANASAITVEEFAASLQQSGAAANLAGISFDDLSTAIAIMGNAGIKGSDAGTSLKTMLLNLNPVTDKQTSLMKKLGIITKDGANQFFDAEGKAKSFGEIAGVLGKSLEGMTQQQKLATLEILFGSDAIRAAAVVADAGTKGFNDMATAMGKVTAAEVAATRMDNLRGALEELKGSLETAAIIVGTYFLPALQKLVDFITKVVNVFNNAPAGVQKFLTIVVALGGGLSLLTGILIKMLFILGPLLAKFLGLMALKSVFSIFTTGFAAFRGGAGILAALSVAGARAVTVFGTFGKIASFLFGVIRTLITGVGALRIAVAFAFGPWGALIAGVVAGVVLLYKKFQPFHDLVNRIGQALQGGFIRALEVGKNAMHGFAEAFKGEGLTSDGLVGFFERAGLAARTLWLALQQLANAFMTKLWPALKQAGGAIWAALVAAFQQISGVVQGQLLPALRQLGAAFAPLVPHLMAAGAAVGQFLMQLFPIIGAILKIAAIIVGSFILALIKIATFIIGTVLPAVIQFATFLLGILIPAFAAVISFIVGVVAAITSFVAGIISFFTGAQQAAGTGAAAIKGVLQGIAAFFVGVIAAIRAVWTAFWSSSFGQLVLNAIGLVVDIIQLGFAAMRFAVSAALFAIRAVVSAVWNFITTRISTGVARAKALVTAAWNAIKAVTSAVWSFIQTHIGSRIAAVAAVVSARTAGIRAVISAAWNAVKSATTTAWNAVTTAIKTAVDKAMAIVKGIKAIVVGALSGAGRWLYNAGKSIIQGLLDGINSMISSVRSKLSELTSLIPDSKGPPEKDKKLLVENGQLIMQGLIDGIASQFRPFEKTLAGFTATIPVTAMSGAQSGPVPKVVLPKKFDQMLTMLESQAAPGVMVDVEVHADEPQSVRINRTMQRAANRTLV